MNGGIPLAAIQPRKGFKPRSDVGEAQTGSLWQGLSTPNNYVHVFDLDVNVLPLSSSQPTGLPLFLNFRAVTPTPDSTLARVAAPPKPSPSLPVVLAVPAISFPLRPSDI